MPAIEVTEQTLEALRALVRDFGETPESVILRLLGKGGGVQEEDREENIPFGLENPALKFLVKTMQFQHLNGRGRYFEILRFLHHQNPEEFKKLTGLKFGKRVLIAPDGKTIEESGKSTFPEQIPGTEYWALTNLSNRSKRDVIFAAMRMLGHSDSDIRLAVNSIPDTNPERSSSSSSSGL